jgi:hypothetical protein
LQSPGAFRDNAPVLRKLAFVLAFVCFALPCADAFAAPRDKAALKKIDEAISTHYLNMNFDEAEGLLLGTIRACEDKCSPEVLAKAWMYVGVVRGAGRNDLAGALEAFTTAVTTDPNVKLDEQVATDPVKDTFKKAKGAGGGGGGGGPAKAEPSEGGGGKGGLTCTPGAIEMETRRPVPVQCESDGDLKSAKLHYKTFSGKWQTLSMEMAEGVWRGTIPCAASGSTGKLRFYVEGLDSGGDVAATSGSKEDPTIIDVVSESSADPPTFPGEEPPQRCSIDQMGGEGGGAGGESKGGSCGAWGAPCGENNCCETGLTCTNGTCESAQCESDSDCKNGGTCTDGKCEGGDEESEEGDKKGVKPYKKNLIGLHVGWDLASVSSDNACSSAAHGDHFACFYGGGVTYQGDPTPSAAGKIAGGFAPATVRIMASYERLFGSLGVEGRLGFAFNGGDKPTGGTAFVPVHVEVRGKWWLLGEKAFGKRGLRPWLHLGAGFAQIDARVGVDVGDCSVLKNGQPNPQHDACLQQATLKDAQKYGAFVRHLTAQKQLGQEFATAGGGIMYALGENHGFVLNLNFMVPFPSTAFVIEPSLGYVVGL